MSNNIDMDMRIMQDNICEIRKIAGWTAETLAKKLGITKQTVSNLENKKVNITRIQYIAIRAVLECEMSMSPDNTTLRKVMSILFDILPLDYDVYQEKVRTAMVSIASVAVAGISGAQLHSSAVALFSPLGRMVSQANSFNSNKPSLEWMIEYLQNCNETEYSAEEDINENS